MIPGARLVMLGRQGAGKGTQCVRLSRHYVVPHISTGDMLRAAVKEGTELGRQAQEVMDRGELVSDELMSGIVEKRLERDDTKNRGYILDGFPRTVGQAEALEKATTDRPLDLVIDLEVPVPVVLERLASRRVCVDCGANYSADKSPTLWLGLRQLRWRGRPACRRQARGDPEAARSIRARDRTAHRLVRGARAAGTRRGDGHHRPGDRQARARHRRGPDVTDVAGSHPGAVGGAAGGDAASRQGRGGDARCHPLRHPARRDDPAARSDRPQGHRRSAAPSPTSSATTATRR